MRNTIIKSVIVSLLLLIFTLLPLLSCTQPAPSPTPSPAPTPAPPKTVEKKFVTFGVLGPKTGPVAMMGDAMTKGVQLACEEINTKWNAPNGGIVVNKEVYHVKFEFYDDQASPANSPLGFRKLVEMYKVPFVLGPLGTPQSWACSPISQELGVLFYALSAADQTRKMGNPYLFQSRPPSQYMARPMAEVCVKRGVKRFAVLSDVSEAYVAWAKDYKEAMEKLGAVSVGFEIVDTKTVTDYQSVMTKFNAEKPDIIFINAYEEPNSRMAMHALEIGYKGVFLGNENFTDKAMARVGADKLTGSLLDVWTNFYYRDHPDEDPTGAVAYLWKKYLDKGWGPEPWHGLVGNLWDVTLNFVKAMEVAGTTTDSLAIRAALDKSSRMVNKQMVAGWDGVLTCGVMTGWKDLLCEVQPGGKLKKVAEIVTPTEFLDIYKNPNDSPLYKLLKEKGRYEEMKTKGFVQ